jgi:hypothetical protein
MVNLTTQPLYHVGSAAGAIGSDPEWTEEVIWTQQDKGKLCSCRESNPCSQNVKLVAYSVYGLRYLGFCTCTDKHSSLIISSPVTASRPITVAARSKA